MNFVCKHSKELNLRSRKIFVSNCLNRILFVHKKTANPRDLWIYGSRDLEIYRSRSKTALFFRSLNWVMEQVPHRTRAEPAKIFRSLDP